MTSIKNHLPDALQQSIHSHSPISGPLVGVNICVVGGGFVGLVAAAGFAQFGHKVVCVEKDSDKLAELQAGKVPFFERDLEELIKNNMQCNRLSFSNDLEEAVDGQQAIFVTVGTPPGSSGRADMGALQGVVETLSHSVQNGQVIVLKSTVPIGTANRVRGILAGNGYGERSVAVINNPEFLREGTAVFDFFHPQRIVIGGGSPDAIEFVKHIYRLGMTRPVPIVITNNATAEMIKYASNVFLATKIGFANELAGLCDTVGVNVLEVAHAMGLDPRIGPDFLNPGPGWGGSCLPKDLSEFVGLSESQGTPLLIGKAVLEANQKQFESVVGKVRKLVGELKGKQIGVLGLSFKAGTSDMRGSPTIPIIQMLIAEGAHVIAFDPAAARESAAILPEIDIVTQGFTVASNSDCLLILTEWPEFQLLDWRGMAEQMRNKNLVDSRNLLSPEMAHQYGYKYLSMGQV
jgi:UDPglucose 6-dehydrogenase